ncbi:unnamed protein product, partial [Porites evermanni]
MLHQWWNEVRKLCGSKKQNSSLFSSLNMPIFHYALPKYLTYLHFELERVQKRALSCIFPGISSNDALSIAGIDCMRVH